LRPRAIAASSPGWAKHASSIRYTPRQQTRFFVASRCGMVAV
jgi:hypothetical protein